MTDPIILSAKDIDAINMAANEALATQPQGIPSSPDTIRPVREMMENLQKKLNAPEDADNIKKERLEFVTRPSPDYPVIPNPGDVCLNMEDIHTEIHTPGTLNPAALSARQEGLVANITRLHDLGGAFERAVDKAAERQTLICDAPASNQASAFGISHSALGVVVIDQDLIAADAKNLARETGTTPQEAENSLTDVAIAEELFHDMQGQNAAASTAERITEAINEDGFDEKPVPEQYAALATSVPVTKEELLVNSLFAEAQAKAAVVDATNESFINGNYSLAWGVIDRQDAMSRMFKDAAPTQSAAQARTFIEPSEDMSYYTDAARRDSRATDTPYLGQNINPDTAAHMIEQYGGSLTGGPTENTLKQAVDEAGGMEAYFDNNIAPYTRDSDPPFRPEPRPAEMAYPQHGSSTYPAAPAGIELPTEYAQAFGPDADSVHGTSTQGLLVDTAANNAIQIDIAVLNQDAQALSGTTSSEGSFNVATDLKINSMGLS